jgi:cytochrome c peroxidase
MLVVSLAGCKKEEVSEQANEKITFQKPTNFPDLSYDLSKNPLTKEGIALGRRLFYEPLLSRDNSISCASCHIQENAFTHHSHTVSHGIDDKLGKRNAPAIQNMGFMKAFFWDGGVGQLDLFPIAPIENVVEMDEKLGNVLNKLRNTQKYPELFKKAFGTTEINSERFLKVLSQFMIQMVSANSKYDKYIRNEGQTLTSLELSGLKIFQQKCTSCHSTDLFTDQTYRNNGLVTKFNDLGRFEISQIESDKYKFKVPSLRNVAITQPYMHDGRFGTLQAVLNHYASGVQNTQNLDENLKNGNNFGIALSEDEKQKIIAFLQTLTDVDFIKNPDFSGF